MLWYSNVTDNQRVTDGQTDGQNYYINIARQQQYMLTRDKKGTVF